MHLSEKFIICHQLMLEIEGEIPTQAEPFEGTSNFRSHIQR